MSAIRNSNSQMASKAESLLEQTPGANRLKLLQGYEGVWITARRNNTYYILNKILSISIAAFFAAISLSIKRSTLVFSS